MIARMFNHYKLSLGIHTVRGRPNVKITASVEAEMLPKV